MDISASNLSPQVRNIASLVYSEFERLVSRYGEGVVDGVVPIIIQTLEQVDQLQETNERLQMSCAQNELELDSLTAKLGREIKARRAAEEKIMALEDEIAELRVQMDKNAVDCARLIRVLEAKVNAANEHVVRQEANEVELRRDLANAQKRYNELLHMHFTNVQRVHNQRLSSPVEGPPFSALRQTWRGEIENPERLTSTQVTTEIDVLPSPSTLSLDDHNPDQPAFGAPDET